MQSSLQADIADLLQEQKLMVLCTQSSSKGPYCSLVAFAASKSLKFVFFATRRETSKFYKLQQEPRVSLLIDNRQNLALDFSQAKALTVTGTAAEVDKFQFRTDMDMFLGKHPDLRHFVQGEDNALVRIEVQSYYLVQNFEQIQQLDMI